MVLAGIKRLVLYEILFIAKNFIYKSKHQNGQKPFKISGYTIFIKNKAGNMGYCLQCGHKAERKIPPTDNVPRLVCPNCHYIHYENPKVICGSLVIHENRVLLCRRAIEPQYGLWTLPAGFMENGETMAEGAARESYEEAEAVVINPRLYCLYDIPDIGQIYSIYLTELKDGAYGIGSESLDCALFKEEDIPWDEIAFEAVRRTLNSYFEDRKTFDTYAQFPVHQDYIGKDQSIKRY